MLLLYPTALRATHQLRFCISPFALFYQSEDPVKLFRDLRQRLGKARSTNTDPDLIPAEPIWTHLLEANCFFDELRKSVCCTKRGSRQIVTSHEFASTVGAESWLVDVGLSFDVVTSYY